MASPLIHYDQISDSLSVTFVPEEKGTGIQLNDHILLRVNKSERKALGITFFEYSVLAQRTEVGPRSFPLTGLAQLSTDLRELVLGILQEPPVNQVLSTFAYTPSAVETIPIISLDRPLAAAA